MKNAAYAYWTLAILASLGSACSSDGSGDTTHTGGKTGSGGAVGSGGNPSSGGISATGGSTLTGGLTGTGGTVTNTGGTSAGGSISTTGGNAATGGKVTTGGSATSGGKAATGGAGGTANGGAASGGRGGGGKSSTGGTVSTGGSGTGTGGAGGTASGTGGSSGTGGGEGSKSAGCGKAPSLKSGNGQTLSVSGSNRTFNLKVPDNYDNNKAYRLIIGYHWLNGTANNVSDGSGTAKSFYGLWDLAGGSTIFVAPQGINNGWNNSGGADVEFSKQLITKLESEFCIDHSRIFCEGFSMGGSMSYAMACAMPDTIRAVAVHSGGPMSGCVTHSKPVAYFMTHGTKDSVCTYPGYGVPQLQDFAKMNKCTKPDPSLSASAFEAALPEPTSTASACVDFEGCTPGYPTRSCLFVGDHTPSPDGTNGWVPKETWKFFSLF